MNVRIAVLDSHDQVLTHMDNLAPKSIHYYNDELHEYLKGSACTYSFTCSADHEDSQFIVEGNKISFVYNQRGYYFNIMHVEKDKYEISAECYGLLFELLNEDVGPYAASSAMTFEQYLAVFDPEGTVTIGVNEIYEKTITNEWTGTETLLARIYSLATVFGAEIEFVTVLNDNYSLNQIIANVYIEHSTDNQGIGQTRTDFTLRYGREITGIRKTSDITNLYTAIRPTGKDGLKITDLNKTEYDEYGNIEYSSPTGDDSIRAVQARDRFPSNLTKEYDGYIMRVWSYDTDNAEMLYGQALAELKKICEPEVSYEVSGYVDTNIGDTVEIVDEEYNPVLYLSARVTEQVKSFTDTTRNKTVFDNFRELQSEIDQSLIDRVEELIEAGKSYNAYINSSNGLIFKNNAGSTTLTASITSGIENVTGSMNIEWFKDGSAAGTGDTLSINASDVTETATYSIQAKNKNGDIVATAQVTIADVSDGKDGANGTGVTSVDVQYYSSTSNTTLSGGSWSTSSPTWQNGRYIWSKTVITYTDGTQKETQPACITGEQGNTGQNGANGVGVSSITEQYYNSTSPTSLSGGSWSNSYPGWQDGRYIWTRSIITYTNGQTTTTSAICVTGSPGQDGKDGTDGTNGTDGKDGQMLYATSTTASGTAAKTATLAEGNLQLTEGATVSVRFTNNNTAANPTLNIAGTGAKPIMVNGVNAGYWQAGAAVTFVYDGTYWQAASQGIYGTVAIIGNPAGFNVLIDGDSVEIRNGNTVLSKYDIESISFGDRALLTNTNLQLSTLQGGPTSLLQWAYLSGIGIGTYVDGIDENTYNAIEFYPSGRVEISNLTVDNAPLMKTFTAKGNLKIYNNNSGFYTYGGYQTANGAPSDWSGSMYVFHANQNGDEKILKYAFSSDGQIYFLRMKASDKTIEQDWKQV